MGRKMPLKKAPDIIILIVIGLVPLLHRTHCDIIISEIQTISSDGNSNHDNKEFIELYNPDNLPVLIEDYTLVLYKGDSNQAYAILSFSQQAMIAPRSYYTVGSSKVSPQPNKLLDEKGNVNILPSCAGIALYHSNGEMFVYNMQVTNVSITDAFVYDETGHNCSTPLARALTQGEVFRSVQVDTLSTSRCNTGWTITFPTPGSTNDCTNIPPVIPPPFSIDVPPQSLDDLPSLTDFGIPTDANLPPYAYADANLYPFVVINEFDIDSQFVELYDGGTGGVKLDGLILVFYSGVTSTVYANPINLNGYETDANGYFLLAPANQFPALLHLLLLSAIRSEGVNAIAIHFGIIDDLRIGSPVTTEYLVDAVVYGDISDPEDNFLVSVLSQGHLPLKKKDRESESNVSLSRCRGWAQFMPQSFRTTPSSPLAGNVCELPTIVINEVNVVGETSFEDQYIELYDGGLGHQSLDGLIIALYDGDTSALYHSYDLTGFTTDAKGFAVIGFVNASYVNVPVHVDPENGFLEPGLNAVALHLGAHPRFQQDVYISTYNLVDAIVYGTGDDPDLEFLHSILPLHDIPNELPGYGDEDHSISRCACCAQLDPAAFGVGPVSPGEINRDCMRNSETVTETLEHYQNIVRINEVHVDVEGSENGEFVELYDSGFGGIPLDDMAVVIYNGNGDERSSRMFSLSGYQTNPDGYLVIGTSNITPVPGIIVETHTLFPSQVSGAAALYKVSTEDMLAFTARKTANRDGLIDTVVYGNAQDFDLQLVEILVPGQSPVNIANIRDEKSILRCFSRKASDQLGFAIGQSSPGSDNLCPLPPIVINEVNVQSLAEDVGELVELSSNGVANFPLNNLNMIFWRGRQETAARIYRIDGYQTDSNGFFLIGYQGLISPRPDMMPFPRYTNYIKEASNVISLHVGPSSSFFSNMPVTNLGLVDGVAHRNPHQLTRDFPPSILETLTPGVDPGMEPFLTSPSNRDESLNRCVGSTGNVRWDAAHISPKAPNHCRTRSNVELVINEVSLVKTEQFIELWDKGSGYTSLDDFVIIAYGEDNMSYWTIPLAGYLTDSMGYFVMGVKTTVPHAQFIFADGFLQTLSGAIAVYRISEDQFFADRGPASTDGIIDAVTYSNQDGANELSRILTPDSTSVSSSLLQTSGISLSRCLSHNLRNSSTFSITRSTPKTMNDCPVFADDVFINEINVEQPGDRSKEFIELSDGGSGNTLLTYLSLVLFNGHNDDRSYATFDLDGYSTNDKGFFLIASDRVRNGGADIAISVSRRIGLLQNGPDAIAIYRAPSGALPYDTPPTVKSLVDAIVYNTGDGLSHSLVDKLIPGRTMVLEDASHLPDDESISRCHGNQHLDPLMYSLTSPTPGRRNDCSLGVIADKLPEFYINEISVSIPGKDFIELYNGGGGSVDLNGLILVFFDGTNQDRSYLEIDLHGGRTNTSGYFLIGNKDVSPQPDLIIPDNIHEGPDAIVLYYNKILDFPRGSDLNPLNIVDAVAYGSDTSADSSLVRSLAPGQVMAKVTPSMTLSRCMMGHPVTMSVFHASTSTPGSPNNCSEAPIILNEINLALSKPEGPRGQYIELYDGGRGDIPLDDYILLLYSEDNGKAYKEILLNGYNTNSNGYFLIGNPLSAATLQPHFALPPGFIKEGAGAIALYKNHNINIYFTSMAPTPTDLIDAVVYGTKSSVAMTMRDVLLPGQQQVDVDDGLTSCCDWTISRCMCCETRRTAKFGIGSPTPLRANNCSRTTVVTFGVQAEFIINEIKPRNSNTSTEYIELKGLVNNPLDEYILVLFSDRGRSSYTFDMLEKRTDHNGLVVIGSHKMVPPTSVSFPSSNIPIIPQGTGAVALYRGVLTDFPVGTRMTADGLVDAVVFTSDQTKLENEMTSVLTPSSPSFYAGNFWLNGLDQSISRCQCCQPQTNLAFTLSTATPDQPNQCPSDTYSATIQTRLVNAAYRIWIENPDLVVELKKEIVSGINQYCQCGFNDGYLTDDKILNGSVIYQSTILAVSSNQSGLLIDSYLQYIHNTPKIRLHGTVYAVEGQCVENCSTPAKPDPRKGLSPAEEEAIAILCIVFSSTIVVSVYLCIRYRHQLWSYMKRTRDLSAAGELPVIFRSNNQTPVLADEEENDTSGKGFANPVYLYQSPSQASLPRILVQEPLSASGRSSPRNVEQEHGASGRSSPRNTIGEQGASGRSSPKIAVREQGASGRSSPNIAVREQGAFGRSSPKIVAREQEASGRSSPRNATSEHLPKVTNNGVFRTESLLSKAKKILDGLSPSSAKMDVASVKGSEGTRENLNEIKTATKGDKLLKPKKQESFTNPLYGLNTGPAQLDVTVTQDDDNETIHTVRDNGDIETVDGGRSHGAEDKGD